MRKAYVICLILTCFALTIVGCGGPSGPQIKTVTVKGSDTMVILAQRWAETYMKENPGQSIQVTGGGSGTGIAALINGGTDICNASRSMKDQERDMVQERHGKGVKEIPVALDGVTIYVHQDSPIQSISKEQLKLIYTGQMKNWKDVGGKDELIVPYSRENNSGTYVFFKEHVLDKEDFAPEIQTLPGTAAIVNAVSKDRASIGYGGVAYASGIRAVPVRADENSEPVEASLATVMSGAYPLSRNLYFYTVGEPAGEVKAFIDWVLSEKGQAICEEVGYYPVVRK